MAKWYVDVREEHLTREDLFRIFNDLSCESKRTAAPAPAADNSGLWEVAVKGPKDMNKVDPLPEGVVRIRPR
jgi:hypothetical protein